MTPRCLFTGPGTHPIRAPRIRPILLELMLGLAACAFACTVGSAAALLLAEPGEAAPAPVIRVLDQTAHGLTLEFELPALVIETLTIGGETHQVVSIPDGGESGQTGAPLIPVFNRFLYAPEGAVIRITETGRTEEEIDGVRLIPVQDEESPGFAFDPAAYARDDFGSRPAAAVGQPARMRSLPVRSLTFAPVRYNPAQGKLRVASRIEVRVDFEGADLTAPFAGQSRPVARSFDRLYRQLVVNYDGPAANVRVADGTWLCICPNNAGVLARLQPLADWHQRRGLPVRIATTAETGTTTASIRAYLQNAYDTWADPPEYVALAGDASGGLSIPCFSWSGGSADHQYTQLEGGDLISDVHLGRLSYADTTQLRVIVAKTIGYSSAPALGDPGWFTRATLTGDPGSSGFSTIQVMQWIKTRLRQIGYTGIDTVFNSPWVTQMRTSLNRGGTVFAYRGYLGMSGWSNSDTNALTNYWKLPFAVTSTCGTGDFSGGTAVSEGFLRAGTAAQPRGGIGGIGTATTSTHTRYNNCFTMGVFQGVLYEDQWEMGAAHSRGKLELVLNYGAADPNGAANFCNWNNLMGDPACRVWTGYPAPLTATYAAIPLGANSFIVRVQEEGGSGCPDAQVCLWKGTEIFAVGLTDAQGDCELPISALTPGTARLTVTKQNRHPILADVAVAAQDNFVGYLTSTLDDDSLDESLGNGNGQAEPGETVELRVLLQNFGQAAAGAVTAGLTTSDPYVEIVDGNEDFGSMDPGQQAWSADDFGFSISPAAPHDHVMRFALDVSSETYQWHSLIEIPVISADLVPTGLTVYDLGNGRLDPGETKGISVNLNNAGGADAQATSAVLSTLSQWVSVSDPAAVYGDIPVGQTVQNALDHFAVTASAQTPQGHLAFLRLVTTFNGGAVDTSEVFLTVGQASSDDPVGPDAYGYYAFDNTDTAYPEAPVYAWIEINPALGGSGTQVQLGDYGSYQDKSRAMDLPFTFRFYGQPFERATICSNGWIAMGDTYLTDYRNWTIPGAGAPQNIIAAFWDDLWETTSGGHVFQWYDAANHRFIVEWSRMVNEINQVQETFEAILYDPLYYPTVSGDGIIEFQYHTINNIDGVDGYATVGIQNWDHTAGLLYTYFNRYPPAAAPLAGGRAIRIVPIMIDVTGAEEATQAGPSLALRRAQPNPFGTDTAIAFSLTQSGPVRISLFDPQGRLARTLVSATLAAGGHQVRWDGRDDQGRPVSAGVYFARMEAEGTVLVRKVVRVE